MTDAVSREERRSERLSKRGREYLERLQSAYARTVGSQSQTTGDESQLIEQARFDPVVVGQLYQEIRSRSLSDQDAREKLLRWAKRLNT